MSESIGDRIAEIYAAESRRVLATLIRLLGDIDQAEEALQEAFCAALTVWPRDGIPQNPRAWLVSTGKFKGIDAIRRQGRGTELILQMAAEGHRTYAVPEEWDGDVVQDDQLRLIFTCCHPALPIDARIALSLREVCGLTTEEISRSFLVSVETMKKRISRAKATIRESRIPYEVPSHSDLAGRLEAVLHVVYLVYNEGYSATSGTEHLRRDLAAEAVSLSRLIADLLPEPEATGLLALLLLHESRSAARTDSRGDLIPLEEQDRTLWDRELIAEGIDLVRKSVMSGRLGSYVIQAAIATVHAAADSVETTNWDLIVAYYDMLAKLQDSPVVALNRAIAVGMRDGPRAGLVIVHDLLGTGVMSDYHFAHAARADLACRAGFLDEARDSYRRAIELVRQEPERRYLERRLARIPE
ncbi:MAG: RNA polymerase sigma factor [Gammaproteobacteria bacterium]